MSGNASSIGPRALLAFAALVSLSAAAESADKALDGVYREYLEKVLSLRPLDATRLGDRRFDHLLDDLSPAGRQRWLELDRRTLEQLPKQVSVSDLSADGRLDYEIFRDELTRSIWLAENTFPFEQDPRVYNEYISDGIYLLLTQSTQPRDVNVRNALARMGQIPRVIAAARSNLDKPSRVATETAIRQNRGAIGFFQTGLFELVGATDQGWAVYTEQMMLDQGYGDGDLALRLTQLKFYLRAVGNAILDHKMHCTEMTDDEALELLTQRAFQSQGEARLKVIRSKQSSTQLSTYFVGRTAMVRTRCEVQRELGVQFRLDRYHAALLSLGAVPVKNLTPLVRQALHPSQPLGQSATRA